MSTEEKQQFTDSIADFCLPKYTEIPSVGLYLEQVTKYISEILSPLYDNAITSSMISNYVKKGLIENPVKKQYSREQIAYLIFITTVKSVLSMDNIKLSIDIQKKTYRPDVAYNYFATELQSAILYVCGGKETLAEMDSNSPNEKRMLRNVIITVAHKIYLEKYFNFMQEKL